VIYSVFHFISWIIAEANKNYAIQGTRAVSRCIRACYYMCGISSVEGVQYVDVSSSL